MASNSTVQTDTFHWIWDTWLAIQQCKQTHFTEYEINGSNSTVLTDTFHWIWDTASNSTVQTDTFHWITEKKKVTTVVGEYINTKKTNSDFNLYFKLSNSMDTHKQRSQEMLCSVY